MPHSDIKPWSVIRRVNERQEKQRIENEEKIKTLRKAVADAQQPEKPKVLPDYSGPLYWSYPIDPLTSISTVTRTGAFTKEDVDKAMESMKVGLYAGTPPPTVVSDPPPPVPDSIAMAANYKPKGNDRVLVLMSAEVLAKLALLGELQHGDPNRVAGHEIRVDIGTPVHHAVLTDGLIGGVTTPTLPTRAMGMPLPVFVPNISIVEVPPEPEPLTMSSPSPEPEPEPKAYPRDAEGWIVCLPDCGCEGKERVYRCESLLRGCEACNEYYSGIGKEYYSGTGKAEGKVALNLPPPKEGKPKEYRVTLRAADQSLHHVFITEGESIDLDPGDRIETMMVVEDVDVMRYAS